MERTWRIGEVAQATGLTRRTLRHYEELGLLTPAARSWSDYRLYDEADLLRLLQIQNLKALGLSLAEIADALSDPDLDASATLRSHLDHLEQQIAAEQTLAERLRRLADAHERSWDDVLEAIAATRRLAHPDPTVRIRAALAGSGSVSELMAALIAEPDPAVQEVLIWSLARLPDASSAALARLGDPDPRVRALMTRLLGKRRDAAAAPALLELLPDPDPGVRAGAVRALGSIGAPAAVPGLVGLLGRPDVPETDLLDAITALGKTAVDALGTALAASSPQVRAAAARALGWLATGPSAADLRAQLHPVLTRGLADPDPEVRLEVLLALGGLGELARPELEQALRDPAVQAVARRLLLDLPVT